MSVTKNMRALLEGISVRPSKYRGEEGFTVSGKPEGSAFPVKIFVKDRKAAEAIRDRIKQGGDWDADVSKVLLKLKEGVRSQMEALLLDDVAQTIWKQISTQTKMAVGARELVADKKSLKFKVASAPYRYVMIELDPDDTYTVEYFRLKRGSYEKESVKKTSGIYADQLSDIIYKMVNK